MNLQHSSLKFYNFASIVEEHDRMRRLGSLVSYDFIIRNIDFILNTEFFISVQKYIRSNDSIRSFRMETKTRFNLLNLF